MMSLTVEDYKDMSRGRSVGKNDIYNRKNKQTMTQVYEQTCSGTPYDISLPIEEIHQTQKKRKKAISECKKPIQSFLS